MPTKKLVKYDCEWQWVPTSQALPVMKRGHWRATDGTRVEICPPTGEPPVWLVTVPHGRQEMLLQLGDEETAFHYAARARQARAN